jgi:E3 ubiquitin-protein ligase DOA10
MHAENNIVSIDEDGFHRMDYEKIIVPLVKAVQEQQAQIAEFVKGAKAQETQITELQNKINAIMEMQASALASKSYGEGDQ